MICFKAHVHLLPPGTLFSKVKSLNVHKWLMISIFLLLFTFHWIFFQTSGVISFLFTVFFNYNSYRIWRIYDTDPVCSLLLNQSSHVMHDYSSVDSILSAVFIHLRSFNSITGRVHIYVDWNNLSFSKSEIKNSRWL